MNKDLSCGALAICLIAAALRCAAAKKLRMRIREAFWNASARQFDTCRGTHKRRNGHELTQALAILADVVPEDELKPLAEKLSVPSDWVETTLSQSLHKFEALAKVGPDHHENIRARAQIVNLSRTG